jgi:hypothetical protein
MLIAFAMTLSCKGFMGVGEVWEWGPLAHNHEYKIVIELVHIAGGSSLYFIKI